MDWVAEFKKERIEPTFIYQEVLDGFIGFLEEKYKGKRFFISKDFPPFCRSLRVESTNYPYGIVLFSYTLEEPVAIRINEEASIDRTYHKPIQLKDEMHFFSTLNDWQRTEWSAEWFVNVWR